MKNINIIESKNRSLGKLPFEIVERKGLGHPDSLIDGIMENISKNLSKEYINRFGRIRHHNVDKGLICGGATKVWFGGGRFIKPIKVILSGRAFGDISIEEIARETAKKYLKRNIKNLNVRENILIESNITKIWPSWDEMSNRESVLLANDTSFGIGYAPLTETEKLVLEIEKYLNSDFFKTKYPWLGEDIKIMGYRNKEEIKITIAAAIISKYILNLADYLEVKKIIKRKVLEFTQTITKAKVDVTINSADNEDARSIYLTLSGTSAEMGDDGSVGRGNRANGLITPCRPMTLEAIAGKNPASHPGKIYSILAFKIADSIVKKFPCVENVEIYLLSTIGKRLDEPQTASVLIIADKKYFNSIKIPVQNLVESELSKLSKDCSF